MKKYSNINELFSKLLEEAVQQIDPQFNITSINFMISEPRIPVHIYKNAESYERSTNLVMVLSKTMKLKTLEELANDICDFLLKQEEIKEVSWTKPAFINVIFNSDVYAQISKNLAKTKNYGSNVVEKQNINIEFVSANPTGYLHAGHARNAIVGDTLSNILKFAGHNVTKEYYVNDAGNQINILATSSYVRYQQLFGIEAEMPEDSYRGEDIIQFAKYVKNTYSEYFLNDFDSKINEFKEIAIEWFLVQIKKDLKKIKIVFDKFSSEKTITKTGLIEKALKNLESKTYTQDGALYLKTTDYGDDKDRVLIKSDGSYTYFLPDVAYHQIKASLCDKIINVWGADHSGYVQRLVSSLEIHGFSKENIEIVIIQLVRLIKNGEEFKMSKRKGTAITLRYLLENASADALRYELASRDANTKMDFDIDKSLKMDENNPVFILKEALKKAKEIIEKSIEKTFDKNYKYSKMEINLLIELSTFENVIKSIAKTYKIQLLPQYLIKIVNLFNAWNNSKTILRKSSQYNRILIIKSFINILNQSLKLLGISNKN